ncbi:MAG: cadherin-like beta sandwich domain-containing protein [Paludibacteraceae bacterium]
MKKVNLLLLATLFAGNMMAAYTPTQAVDTIMLTKTNINAQDYLSVSADKWADSKDYGKTLGIASESYFNMSSADRILTVNLSGVESFTVFVYNSNAGRSYSVQVGDAEAQTITHNAGKLEESEVILTNTTGEVAIKIAGTGSSVYPVAIKVNQPAAKDDATLADLTVNGNTVEGFHADSLNYTVELPYGTTEIPVVAATASSDNATVAVTQAAAVDGTATVVVTAEDGTTTRTYTISFTLPAAQSTDATLKSLSIDGQAIADFRADSLDYTHVIAFTAAAIPAISAEVNDASATMVITQAEAIPGTATVVVTAQAGNQQTYTVAISRAKAIKHLTEVVFSNGAKGAINETERTVTVPYMAETEVPTAVVPFPVIGDTTDVLQPSSALSEDGKTILLIGIDQDTAVYTIVTTPLTPVAMGEDSVLNVTFTGEETYIFGAYGWDATKGWKFAKNVDEESNMRNAKGNTRIYMALPAASQVSLTSGSGGARTVDIYVNGVKSSVTETAAAGASITIALNDSTVNFIAIESNQTKGDGGFTAMQLVAPAATEEPENPDPENPDEPENPEEGITDTAIATPATKVIRNGQLLIIREGKTYTAQGLELQ